MANLKSAIKRIATNESKRVRNQKVRSDMRSKIKHVETLIKANELDEAKVAYHKTVSAIDKAIRKGVIHRNNGNRQKARLAQKINKISA